MFNVPEDKPEPVGAFLTEGEIAGLARTVYHRFYWQYGLRPSWGDTSFQFKDLKVKQVKEVLDALSLSGLKVVPMKEGEERLPRPKQLKKISEKDMDKPYEYTNVSQSVIRNRDTE